MWTLVCEYMTKIIIDEPNVYNASNEIEKRHKKDTNSLQ